MRKPIKNLPELLQERLESDFDNDRFDPLELKGTPAKHEPTQIPKITGRAAAKEEKRVYHFNPNEFNHYQLRLMAPPVHANEYEKETLYLRVNGNQLLCTVSDRSRYVTNSNFDLNDLRDSGINVNVPLQAAAIMPLVTKILILHKLTGIKRERDNLEKITTIKQKDNYLQAYIELVVERLLQESGMIKRFKTLQNTFSSELKQTFENIESELNDFLEFTSNVDAAQVVKHLIASNKNSNPIDINTAGANILSVKLKSILKKIDDLEESIYSNLQTNQLKPKKELTQKLPSWTQRTEHQDENQNLEETDLTVNNSPEAP